MTLSEIKDQYAIELGYEDFSAFINQFEGSADEFVKAIDPVFIEYATACCKATQEKCAENAKASSKPKYVRDEWGMNEHLTTETVIDKKSILDPSNIVLL